MHSSVLMLMLLVLVLALALALVLMLLRQRAGIVDLPELGVGYSEPVGQVAVEAVVEEHQLWYRPASTVRVGADKDISRVRVAMHEAAAEDLHVCVCVCVCSVV